MRFVLFSLLLVQDPNAEARALLDQLQSERAELRDQASVKLKALGKSALPELKKAAGRADSDLAARASHLIRVITIAEGLTENVRTVLPGVEERLAARDLHAWTKEFLAVCAETGPSKRYSGLRPADFCGLVGPAIRGARTDLEKSLICRHADILKLTPAADELIPLLKEKDPDVRGVVLTSFRMLGARGAIPEVLPLLKDDVARVRRQAVETLWVLRATDAVPSIVPLLRDPDSDTRWQSVVALASLRARQAVPEILPLLRDEASFVRAAAAGALGALDARDSAGVLIPLLRDPETKVRLQAAVSLSCLGSREGVPLLLEESLKSKEVSVGVLNELRTPEPAKRLREAEYVWPFPGKAEVEAKEFLRALAGVDVDLSKMPEGKLGLSMIPEIRDRWPSRSVAIEEILALAELTYILDSDRLRVMPRKEAIRFWTEWHEQKR